MVQASIAILYDLKEAGYFLAASPSSRGTSWKSLRDFRRSFADTCVTASGSIIAWEILFRSLPSFAVRFVSLLQSQILNHLEDRRVEEADRQLRINPQHKHQHDRRHHDGTFADRQIAQARPFPIQRSME